MKIESIKEKLNKALSKAEKIATKNATLPILSCFLLKAEKDTLTISATNLDLGLEISLPVKTAETGSIAVPGNILTNFVSSVFNDKNITLSNKDTTLQVSTEHTNATIKLFSVEDFPIIPKINSADTEKFIINSRDFLKGLRSVYYAASTSTIKLALSSVYIYSENDQLIFAATDSFRLAEKKIRMKKPHDFGQILLPLKNIPEIIRVFEDIDDDITVSADKNQIAFEYNGIYLTSRLIDAVFPDYRQIIPKEEKTKAVVLKFDLVNSLKISNIFADKFSQVYLSVSEKPKLFEIKTKNADIGENTSKLDAVIKGEAVSMSFNYKYLNDSFQSIESDSISMQFTDANRAMVVRGTSDKSFLYLVMPMNK